MSRRSIPTLIFALCVLALTACQGAPAAPSAIDPEGFTPKDYQDAAWRSIMGAYPDAVRPDVQVVRVIGNEDFASTYAPCMLDQGFTVKVNPDTSFEATTPKGQEEPFALAMYTCEAKYPRPFILSHPDDETSGRTLYAYYRDILIGCLTKLGQTPAPLPSEQVFLQNLNTAERYDPYASLLGNGGMDFQEWNEATTNCPQRPASLGG